MNYVFDTGFMNICYSFVFPLTVTYFGNYLFSIDNETADIFTSYNDILNNPYSFQFRESDSFNEYQNLMVKTGNYLLEYYACMFHGSLVKWKDKGILFTGPSGVGKTTQYRLWKAVHPQNVRMINGDKPILRITDNEIIGYSSPWNGKEQYGEPGMSVPLKAIILLEQGDCNDINLLSPSDAVIPLFKQFIAYPERTDIIQQEADFLDAMLERVPIWKLTNRGNIESAILTRDTLEANYVL